ncbi:hypothetical protein L6R52_27560, partial [Myxococcota bacterium]|nr:hypothetical protein [Myxococcota bacterium]
VGARTISIPDGLLDDVAIHDVTEVAPDVFVLVAEDTRVLRLVGDVLDEIPIAWDDASTIEEEVKPAFSDDCRVTLRRSVRPESDLLRAVDAAGGVAWVTGCSGIVLRVLPFGPSPVAERVTFERATQSQYSPVVDGPPALEAVNAACADHVFVASRGGGPEDREIGRLWAIAPLARATDPSPAFGALGLYDVGDNALARTSVELDSGTPSALTVFDGRIVPVFRGTGVAKGSLHVVGGRSRARVSEGLVRIDASAGRIVAGGELGRVYVSVPSP